MYPPWRWSWYEEFAQDEGERKGGTMMTNFHYSEAYMEAGAPGSRVPDQLFVPMNLHPNTSPAYPQSFYPAYFSPVRLSPLKDFQLSGPQQQRQALPPCAMFDGRPYSASIIESSEIVALEPYYVMGPPSLSGSIPVVDTVLTSSIRSADRKCTYPMQKCTKCGRYISKDLARHMRVHEAIPRFKCLYPRGQCTHKSGYFNRQYDFKKHLLHCHFSFHDKSVKRYNSLSEKLDHEGRCPCGRILTAREYLNSHVMLKDEDGKFSCSDLRVHWEAYDEMKEG